ncbi:MAG TPA: NPCBM/NEW2 domain-containing protein [Verrucomicrobiae bacterium]
MASRSTLSRALAGTPSPFPLVARAEVDGSARALHWLYQKGNEEHNDGTRIILTFTNSDPALELTSIWQARPGPGPVRHAMFLKNISPGKVTIYEQESLDLQVAGPGNGSSVWYINDDGSSPDAIGVYHDQLASGYQKTLQFSENQDFIPFAAVDANGTHGIYIGWEWSIGRISIGASGVAGGVHLKAGNSDGFKTELEGGQTFEVPPGFIGAYAGDLDDAANSLHKYLFNYSMPAILKTDPAYPTLEWNAFAATGKGQGSWDSTETKYYPLIDAIAPLGFEEVVLDIGWWPGDATHKPHPPVGDPVDWPSGILAARDHARNKGLRFGLYWNCNPPMTTPEGQQHRRDDVKYLYDTFHVDFWRSDGTDGNVLQTGGFGPGTRAHFTNDVGYWQTKGYYEVLDSLYATITNFSYENCSGGGRIKDYGILKRCIKIQNQDTYYPIDARRSFYDSSFALHPMQLAALVGSWSEWQATGSVYEFRSASMGAAYWHPDAPNSGNGGPVWADSQKALIKDAVNTYKSWLRPLIRSANLYHIFPRPDDQHWDGVEYYDPVSRKGAIYVFRPHSPIQTQAVKLRGLDAKASYWLWAQDGAISPATRNGAELMQSGLNVELPQPLTSDILCLQEVSLGKPGDLLEPGPFALKPVKTASQLLSTSAELSWDTSRNARFYRVTVGTTPELKEALSYECVTTPSAVISRLPPARQLYWKVEAVSFGGLKINSGPCGTLLTPDGLAKGVVFASDMAWTKANAGADCTVRRDQNLRGNPITINGRGFEKGLWTHAFNDRTPADIVFDISGRKFSVFKASVGLDDLGAKGSVQFQVLVDGQKKAESPIMLPKKLHDLVVDVGGAKEITLRVLNGGDGYSYDHAAWGSARFIETGMKDPLGDSQP